MMSSEAAVAAVERAMALCEAHGGTFHRMRDFVLMHNFDRAWAVFPDRAVEITPATIIIQQAIETPTVRCTICGSTTRSRCARCGVI